MKPPTRITSRGETNMCKFCEILGVQGETSPIFYHQPKIRIKELQQIIYNPKIWRSSPLNTCHNRFLFQKEELWIFNIWIAISLLIFGVFSVRRKKDDECFGYPQAHQDTSSTPFFCSNSVEDKTFNLKDSKFFWGQEANWDNQQPPSTKSSYDNNIPSSHPREKWYNFRSIEVGSTVGVCRSLFGDVKANHNCWAARSRGDRKRFWTEPRWWDSYILGRKIKLLGWNIFENVQTNLELYSKDPYLSNGKNPGWLGYIGDYTTQLYRDYNKPL